MATLEDLINFLPDTVPHNPGRQHMIDHAPKVDKLAFQVLIGTFTAVGTLAAIIRIVVHLRYRRTLFIDDSLVLFATACLLVETGIMYYFCNMLYIVATLSIQPTSFILFTKSELLGLAPFLKWTNIFNSFAWTTNYTIRLSLLAFFRILLRGVSRRLNWYWWFVLIFTVLSWLFNLLENFVNCGASNSFKCASGPPNMIPIAVTATAVDILTDVMIISIPIILLNKTQLRLSQKLRILAFLCLNLFMIAFSLARFLGGMNRNRSGHIQFDVVWTSLWLHLESSVGVLMGGVTAFRTVFASHILERQRHSHKADSQSTPEFLSSPQTGGTLKGLKTFIRRHRRDPGLTTDNVSFGESMSDSMYNYHAFKKEEKRDSETNVSCQGFPYPEGPLPTSSTPVSVMSLP